MTGPFFVDTNVLIYADDSADPEKQGRARNLLRSALGDGSGKVSFQVLTEFFAAATKKLGLSSEEARRRVEIYSSLEVFRPGVADLLAAIDLHRLHQLSIWDALIVRSAQASGCRVLYTEDLQHGQVFDGVDVRDPFMASD
jgi:predicted nucleic acid-binding protein